MSSELGGGAVFVEVWTRIVLLLVVVFFLPNTQQIARDFAPALGFAADGSSQSLRLKLTARWAMALGIVFAIGVLAMSRRSEFLYYQF